MEVLDIWWRVFDYMVGVLGYMMEDLHGGVLGYMVGVLGYMVGVLGYMVGCWVNSREC